MDVGVAAMFAVAFNPEMTGASLHEWIGITAIGGIVTHLLWHWKWLFGVAKRLARRKGSNRSKLRFVLDAALLSVVAVLAWSGLVMSESASSVLGIGGGGGDMWKPVHETAANIMLWVVVLHAVLHWRWVLGVLRARRLPAVWGRYPLRSDEAVMRIVEGNLTR